MQRTCLQQRKPRPATSDCDDMIEYTTSGRAQCTQLVGGYQASGNYKSLGRCTGVVLDPDTSLDTR